MTDTERAKQRIVAEARLMLDGQRNLLQGCRNMVGFRAGLSTPEEMYDDDLLFAVAVESEMDGMPTGPARPYWAPDALAERDRRRTDYIAQVREDLLLACQSLVQKWGLPES